MRFGLEAFEICLWKRQKKKRKILPTQLLWDFSRQRQKEALVILTTTGEFKTVVLIFYKQIGYPFHTERFKHWVGPE